jgi:hypothetical protein
MSQSVWHVGNARGEGQDRRGWIIGHFVDDNDIRRSEDVEIKWGVHSAGEKRAAWQDEECRTTVLLLVKGMFRVELSTEDFVLEHEGDYAMWGPGVSHSWRAEEDSVVITVRWPSTP